MADFWRYLSFCFWYRRLVKFLLHFSTGQCELQRICYKTRHGALRTGQVGKAIVQYPAGCLLHIYKFSMSSCNSVGRVPVWCLGGHEFDSCQGLGVFLSTILVGILVANTCLYAQAWPSHAHWSILINIFFYVHAGLQLCFRYSSRKQNYITI